jgi:tetrahydromethanopterin S-methyltransferase subunit B
MLPPGRGKVAGAGGEVVIVWKKETTEERVKILEKKVEELEGALEGAHTIIRQLRDKDSEVVS